MSYSEKYCTKFGNTSLKWIRSFPLIFVKSGRRSPFFPLSFLYNMLCKTTTPESCRGKKNICFYSIKLPKEGSPISAQAWGLESHATYLSNFIPGHSSLVGTQSHAIVFCTGPWKIKLFWFLGFFGSSSPVLIHTMILKKLEIEASIKAEIFFQQQKLLSSLYAKQVLGGSTFLLTC